MHHKKARRRRAPKASSCTGKTPHETKELADGARRRLIAQGAANVHAYKCGHCRWWHIGHGRKTK